MTFSDWIVGSTRSESLTRGRNRGGRSEGKGGSFTTSMNQYLFFQFEIDTNSKPNNGIYRKTTLAQFLYSWGRGPFPIVPPTPILVPGGRI